MTSKVFIDTNILVYSVDTCDPTKQTAARSLLKEIAFRNNGVLSTQVLQEFYVTITQKLGINPLDAKALLVPLENIETVVVTSPLIRKAADISILNNISFWDALIVAAANDAGCKTVYTEDLNHKQTIENISIINPFFTGSY